MTERKMPEGLDWQSFTPKDSPMTPMDWFADPVNQDLSATTVTQGEAAFYFRRPLFDFSSGTKVETGRTFDLQEISADKPVALIFGSYT
jgi:hypothetical protein